MKGKIVLVGKAAVIPVNFDPPAKRRADDQVKQQYDPNNPNAGRGRGGFGGGGRGGATPDPNRMTPAQVAEAIDAMLLSGGALVRLNDAARGDGIIVAQQHRAYDPTKTVPTLILRNDDYGRIERLLADGEDVKMEFNIVNHVYPEGKTSYNVVGEIPGTDKADEVVMLGGHLDSWHAATGATDNAIGSIDHDGSGAADSEARPEAAAHHSRGALVGRRRRAARIAGLCEAALRHVRKSQAGIRQAGLLLQRGYRHRPAPRRGRLRTAGGRRACCVRCCTQYKTGASAARVPPAAAPPAARTARRSTTPGLPGVGLPQDPIEYNSMTHHTNLDTYERIIPDDVQKAAAIVAASVWHVANRDQMMPRFTKETMPLQWKHVRQGALSLPPLILIASWRWRTRGSRSSLRVTTRCSSARRRERKDRDPRAARAESLRRR